MSEREKFKPYQKWRHPPGCPDGDWCRRRAMGWEPRLMGWYHKQSFSHIRGPRPNLAESIDAQEALPGRIVEVRHGDVSGHGDKVMWHARAMQDDDMGWRTTFAPTEPLARLAARLRAMAAAQEARDGQ